MEEIIEGSLQLKKDSGGYRHFVMDGREQHDILCGTHMDVQLAIRKDDDQKSWLEPGPWLKGRYEASLEEPVKAYLHLGEYWPGTVRNCPVLTLPLGVMVRVRK